MNWNVSIRKCSFLSFIYYLFIAVWTHGYFLCFGGYVPILLLFFCFVFSYGQWPVFQVVYGVLEVNAHSIFYHFFHSFSIQKFWNDALSLSALQWSNLHLPYKESGTDP